MDGNVIDFLEHDGTLRRLVWNSGEPAVGIWPGWGVSEDDTYLADLQERAETAQTRAVVLENLLRKLCAAVRNEGLVSGCEVCSALAAAEKELAAIAAARSSPATRG